MARRGGADGAERLARRGLWVVMAILFFGIGLQKLTAYEAFAVQSMGTSSPFLAWLYEIVGVRAASWVFAAIEVPTGLALLYGAFRPRSWPARLGAAAAAVTSFVTASFLFTAPGVLVSEGKLKLLSLEVGQLFLKDLLLLAVALLLLAESLRRGR